jgi:predicted acyl esterase
MVAVTGVKVRMRDGAPLATDLYLPVEGKAALLRHQPVRGDRDDAA